MKVSKKTQKELEKTYTKYEDKLKEWSLVNYYKTKTARSALMRFATWLDLEDIKQNNLSSEEKLLQAVQGALTK